MLDEPVSLNNFISTICLPNGEEPKVGEVCYASGFGETGNLYSFAMFFTLYMTFKKSCNLNDIF